MDMQKFYEGKLFDAYKYFGAHIENNGVTFRTFAPNANRVTVKGDFSNFEEVEMTTKVYGVYEVFIDGAHEGQKYEYCIYSNGKSQVHCDPYGFSMELRPDHKSIIVDLDKYKFNDKEWIEKRTNCIDKPLNVYEVHLGSWKKKNDEWYTYSEISDLLIPYVKENNYSHIEVMPLSEHPFDGSWGYQNTGFFAPTSRYGTPDELKYFVDKCHEAGIGVIMDFVPVHFAVDDYGLKLYDGTALFEYPHEDVGQSEWGSYNFIHSRREVACFLNSAANYWIEEYHFDGLRMDAISRAIYWQGDPNRGVNGQAVDFIKTMNEGLHKKHDNIMLIAEDSTSFENITKKVSEGGLEFDYKWDMGWMNDTLNYFKLPPEERTEKYHMLTFSMMYFYNDRYLLPLSHDEVVHCKKTILDKMYGEYEDKFKQCRAFYLYMYMHPGKKLNFMGNEIGQFREWDENRQQDWNLLEVPKHEEFSKYMRELNKIYLSSSELYDGEYDTNNFKWADCHQEDKCIYAIYRGNEEGNRLLAIFNFSNKTEDYELDIENASEIKLLLNTNWNEFGGDIDKDCKQYNINESDGKKYLSLSMQPYFGLLFNLGK